MIQPVKFLRVMAVTAAVSCACLVSAAAASMGVGTVQADALRLRSAASTDSAILATASEGDAVIVLEDAGNNWYKVDYESVQGYMSGEYLTISQKADAAIGYGKVNAGGSSLNMRSAPSTSSSKVASLADGAVVKIIGVDGGWYKVDYNGKTGYVSSDYMITTKETTSRGSETTAAASSSMGEQVVAYAKQFLGTPYVYGGNGPNSFDCSGFTKYVYAHFGVTAPPPISGPMVLPSPRASFSPAIWSFSRPTPPSRSPMWASTSAAASSFTPPPIHIRSRSTT